jgi:transposase
MDVFGRSERSELSQSEAAELLGLSERTLRRWRDRQREAGVAGSADGRLVRQPPAEPSGARDVSASIPPRGEDRCRDAVR